MKETSADTNLIAVTSRIVAAHVANNAVPPTELAQLINEVHGALAQLSDSKADRPRPAVPIEESIHHEFIVCLEDGRRMKTLKRHLKAAFGLTPEEYRAKWRLPLNYPMVAEKYSGERRQLAKRIGLGRKPRA